MSFNLLATFQQNQSKIISAVQSGTQIQNFQKQLAPTPAAAAPSSSSSSSSLSYYSNTPSNGSSTYSNGNSGSTLTASSLLRPAAGAPLTSNAAAKAKSQPRPLANGSAAAASSSSRPFAAASSISSSSANTDYAASILGSSITAPSITAGRGIYSAPPPAIKSATPAAPAVVTPAPSGPQSNIVKSTTNANVSLTKAAATTYDTSKCPECGPSAEIIVDPHQGVEVCTHCGLVLGTYISEESEWRTFSDRRGDDPNRVGGPEIGLLADAGLATLMGDSPNGLGSSLAKLQNKSALSANHRVLLDAFRKSSRISGLLSLPDSLTNRANELYKRIIDSKTIRTRGSDVLIVTCLYMVCKSEHVPRTIKEMCSVSEINQKELSRCFKEIKKLGFHKTLNANKSNSSSQLDDEDADEYKSFIARWGNQIRLSPKLIDAAKSIAEKARDVLHTSRDPGSICGAALYIASQCGTIEERKMLTTISAVVSMSQSTIRSVIQSILQNKMSILPPEYCMLPIEV